MGSQLLTFQFPKPLMQINIVYRTIETITHLTESKLLVRSLFHLSNNSTLLYISIYVVVCCF